MPVSPELAAGLARATVDLYADAERILLARIARALGADLDAPAWAEQKLLQVQLLRLQAEQLLAALTAPVEQAVAEAVAVAYNRGTAAAVSDLAGVLGTALEDLADPVPGTAAVQRLVAEAVANVTATHARILRVTLDAYRQVIVEASGQVLLGTVTRREAAQRALNDFAARGITGFVDRAGRGWSLTGYVEMAVRTTTAKAALNATADRFQSLGQDLVIVSDAPQECKLCRPFEGKVLSLTGATVGRIDGAGGTRVADTLTGARSAGLFHPGCVVGETLVSAPTGVGASDARRYVGDLVVIHTASSNELAITPNHPVLTPEGWITAGALQVGQRLVSHRSVVERMNGVGPDDEHVPARIGEVHHALREASVVPPVRVPATAEQFHGDGRGSDVEVVLADGLLQDRLLPGFGEQRGDASLLVGRVRLPLLLGRGAKLDLGEREDAAGRGRMRSGGLGGTLLCRHGSPLSALGLAAADLSAPLDDPAGDAGLTDPEGLRELWLALAGDVALDEVVYVGVRESAGRHVYNLQTGGGWYAANGIVVHNCRHSYSLYQPGITKAPTRTADPEGDAARQRLRAMERHVREWKRREAAALDDRARDSAAAKVREWQGAIRKHTETTTAKRQRPRERIGAAR